MQSERGPDLELAQRAELAATFSRVSRRKPPTTILHALVFVHFTAVQAAGLNGLDEGQRVTYGVVTERGKQAAGNLRLA